MFSILTHMSTSNSAISSNENMQIRFFVCSFDTYQGLNSIVLLKVRTDSSSQEYSTGDTTTYSIYQYTILQHV